MAALLVLTWQEVVPQSWYWVVFAIALALFLIRIALRLVLARQERVAREAREASGGGGAPPSGGA